MDPHIYVDPDPEHCKKRGLQINQLQMLQLQQGLVKRHIKKWAHLRYSCCHCDYAATTVGFLTIHIKNKHQGIRYLCPKCDNVATSAKSLKRPDQSK